LRDERELRRARERNLFTKKSDPIPSPTGPAFKTTFVKPDPRPRPQVRNQPNVAKEQNGGQYAGAWTDPSFVPENEPKKKKKTGAMKWLDPDWSIVRFVKNMLTDEEEQESDQYHQKSQ